MKIKLKIIFNFYKSKKIKQINCLCVKKDWHFGDALISRLLSGRFGPNDWAEDWDARDCPVRQMFARSLVLFDYMTSQDA